MSAMQSFYSRLSTDPSWSPIGSLASLTQANLSQLAVLADGWWNW